MASAEFNEVIEVDKDKLFTVITKYEEYPQFVDGVTSVHVERKGPGHARVKYHVSMMKDVQYTLDLHEDSATGVVHWTLVESDFFKKNDGRWEIKHSAPGKTHVKYILDVEFKIPVPGLILNRLVKGSLPSMVKSLQKRAKG